MLFPRHTPREVKLEQEKLLVVVPLPRDVLPPPACEFVVRHKHKRFTFSFDQEGKAQCRIETT